MYDRPAGDKQGSGQGQLQPRKHLRRRLCRQAPISSSMRSTALPLCCTGMHKMAQRLPAAAGALLVSPWGDRCATLRAAVQFWLEPWPASSSALPAKGTLVLQGKGLTPATCIRRSHPRDG